MSDIVEPKKIDIAVTLHKDLHGNEEICPTCKGVGLVIADNPYGLEHNADNNHLPLFPYKHQALRFCPTCYNGVVHRCKLCGEIIPNHRTKCDCNKQRELDWIESKKMEAVKLTKAMDAPQEVLDESLMFYSNDYDNNDGYFSDWDEFFENWYENHKSDDPRPEYVWATEPYEMRIDAGNIIESATECLYEDAYYDISDKEAKELQDFLDKWCKESGVRTTYFQSKYRVKIPWEEY